MKVGHVLNHFVTESDLIKKNNRGCPMHRVCSNKCYTFVNQISYANKLIFQ